MKKPLRILAVVTLGAILSYPLFGVVRNGASEDFSLEGLMRWMNPTLCLCLAALLVAAWIITALFSRSRWPHLFMGLAAICYIFLYHL